MPHRTVFQWGKNHAHPFTVFLGGFVIGGLVTAAIMYSWGVASDIDNLYDVVVVEPVASSSPSPVLTPGETETPVSDSESQVQF